MARRTKVNLPRPELNITAMMDLVLNLVTFFVLVANFASASLPGLAPPQPDKSLAKKTEAPNKITVNVLPSRVVPGAADHIMVGVSKIAADDFAALDQLLRKEISISANVEIDLRADRSLRYDQVQPVMTAIASAGVVKINLVALPGN